MDMYFNLHKVKFNVLDNILNLTNTNYNVFINLESIAVMLAKIDKDLRQYHKSKVINFVSNVINLAAHYRLYFAKEKHYARVFIYLGYPYNAKYINASIYEDYRSDYNNYFSIPDTIGIQKIIRDSIPIINLICEYIDGVYFITSGNIEPSMIPMVLTENLKDNTNYNNIIISKDKYDYQYVLKDFTIIRPKRDNSYVLNKNNILNQMGIEEKMYKDINLNPNVVPFILSILGSQNRSIDKIKGYGFKTIVDTLNKGVNKGVISDKVNNPFILSKVLTKNIESVMKNYLVTDIDTQYKRLSEFEIYSITSQLIDKFDDNSLKEICDKYFTYYPLNILEINSCLKYKKIKIIF